MATSTDKVKTPKTRKLIVIVVALVAVGITAAAATAYYLNNNHTGAEAIAVPINPVFVALEPFTVNLQPNGKSRFLHVAVTLKVSDVKSQSQVTQYLPEVRSRVLTVLSNRQPDSLLTPDDKSRLASEIMTALNQPFAPNLPSQKIASVMFTTFMLQ